ELRARRDRHRVRRGGGGDHQLVLPGRTRQGGDRIVDDHRRARAAAAVDRDRLAGGVAQRVEERAVGLDEVGLVDALRLHVGLGEAAAGGGGGDDGGVAGVAGGGRAGGAGREGGGGTHGSHGAVGVGDVDPAAGGLVERPLVLAHGGVGEPGADLVVAVEAREGADGVGRHNVLCFDRGGVDAAL